jgi:DNA helicase-2/ATP-dependent DNA helicase PcrA
MSSLDTLAQSLNPPQREAMETLTGPLLILAGAGSGKTRVLTFRTAALIAEGLATPQEFLAVTFTNKAAREMEGRILKILREMDVPIYDRMWISTFHAICARILREHIHLLGYQPFFGIYDSSDQLSMIKKVCSSLNIDEKIHPAKSFQARINNAKTEGLLPHDVRKRRHLMDDKSLTVYERYEEDMKRSNSLDFADLLLKTYELFMSYPVVLEGYQKKFKFLMVDEYQDTNHIQYLLVKKLAEAHRNLCVVGDEDQSIYSWRGADITNILTFEKDFPECKVVKLEQNYRSSQTIVNASTHLIKNNSERKDKTLFTDNPAGFPITVREEGNEYDEARFVVRDIEAQMSQSELDYSEVAIFYRTNAQSRVLEEQLRSHNIPYKIVGGVKFYERMEIKDMLGYMKLVLNPTDDVALKRIINVPARGIGKTTVDRLEEFAATRRLSLIEAAAAAVDEREFNASTTRKLREFLDLIQGLRSKAPSISLPEFYHAILDATSYVVRLKEEDTAEAESRIENLEELDNAISKFAEERGEEATLQTFLEEMSLVSDIDSVDDEARSVTMMTLHISKGLEYPIVYIVGLEEGLFPSGRSVEGENESGLEEERRLMYVGMTRAEKKLSLTYARTRKVWGSEQFNPPSRFLKEIPAEYVQFQTSMQQPRFMQNARGAGGNASGFGSDSFRGKGRGTSANADSDFIPNYEDIGDTDFDATPAAEPDLKKGMRVRHPTYGVGSVFKTEGNGPDLKISVVFTDNTIKKFVAKYARLERV